jgi:hypothetical protein
LAQHRLEKACACGKFGLYSGEDHALVRHGKAADGGSIDAL